MVVSFENLTVGKCIIISFENTTMDKGCFIRNSYNEQGIARLLHSKIQHWARHYRVVSFENPAMDKVL